MKSKVSIVVPCYNSELTIKKCVSSILNSINHTKSPEKFEVIIVNDGSADQTLQIINNILGVKVINHNQNLGLSAARNSGIKASASEYIIFIDSDIILSNNWINSIYDSINSNKDIVGITGKLEPEPNKKVSSLDKYLFGVYRGSRSIKITTPLNYKYFVFSNTIIRKNILDDVGFFDETINKYGGEDTELAIRISKKYCHGIRKLDKIKSYHITQKSIDIYLDNMFEYGKYNFYKIIKKHPTYKFDLGYGWVKSIKSMLVFNRCSRSVFKCFLRFSKHPYIIKFLVIDAFIRGAKKRFS